MSAQIVIVVAAPGYFTLALEIAPQPEGGAREVVRAEPVIAWRIDETGDAKPVTVGGGDSLDRYSIEHPDGRITRHRAYGRFNACWSREDWAACQSDEANEIAARLGAMFTGVGATVVAVDDDDGIPF